MPQNTQTRVIRVVAQVNGDREFRNLARQISRVNRNTQTLSTGFSRLGLAFQSLIAGFGVREIVNAIDEFQLLEDRIKAFTGSAEEAALAFDSLAGAARFTRTSVASLAESYTRIALATKELGLSQDEILATTTLLQQTFRISGATIAEATASTIQLAQGLASGQLRGQELRSVLEQNVVFAGLLAEELQVTSGQLIRFAEAGTITSDRVLNALFKNFQQLNDQAGNLGTTIGQALTIALDQGRLKLREFNKELEISGRITRGILFIADNLSSLGTTLAAVLGVAALPKAIALLKAAAASLFTVQAAIVAIVGGGVFLATTWETSGRRISIVFNELQIGLDELRLSFGDFVKNSFNGLFDLLGISIKVRDSLGSQGLRDRIANLTEENKNLAREIDNINDAARRNSFEEFLRKVSEGFLGTNRVIKTVTGDFAALNAEFGTGTENLLEYNEALQAFQLERINQQFDQGRITLEAYTNQFIRLNNEVEKLSRGEQILLGLDTGLNDVINGVGNLSTQIRSSVGATFSELEDQLVSFVKTGELSFKNFTQSVLDELTKIVIRLSIIRPLAQSLLGAFAPGAASAGSTFSFGNTAPSPSLVAANGAALNNGNVIPFANGGIVNGDTLFPMSGGRTGLMGEAGPEAIIPLERGSNGKLGVNASGAGGTIININNFSDNQVEATETQGPNGERQIDILVTRSVTKAISNGSLDRTFNSSYGLQRRGS